MQQVCVVSRKPCPVSLELEEPVPDEGCPRHVSNLQLVQTGSSL